MNGLKRFFDEERKQVVQPGPFFTQKVMARLDQRPVRAEIWDVVPNSTRPVFALALVLMLCFLIAEVFLPQMPTRGLIESYLETEEGPVYQFLYTREDDELPTQQEFYEQMVGLGDEN
jgi:hypothetical protein